MMDLSSDEVGPTEGTVLALLDFFVDPLLPSKCVSKEPSQEELVAKQVHAVVLLYNYYHRKQNPALEFLDLVSFCKLALILKPSFVAYLKLMQRTDDAELDELEQHLSLTEKEIMNACDISKSLDASNSEPNIDGWPITKVAVFLVDYKKENCFLFHSSVTQGAWSVIEKELPDVECASEARFKKKRVIRKTPKEDQYPDEAVLQQVAYSAIKEACGLHQSDLRISETHTVYSTSKPNAAVRLYIMQCTQSKHDENLVPIDDAMNSLQGPLVKKELGSWIATPVLEYFHLLPFADKVSKWLSSDSETHDNAVQGLEAEKENGYFHSTYLQVEEGPNPSCHFEAVKKPDSHNNSHLNHNVALRTPESLGTAKDGCNGNNSQSKVDILKHNSQVSGAVKEIQIGSNCLAKEEFISFASVLPETAKEVRNGSTVHSNKELFHHAPDNSKTVKEVENTYIYRNKEPVVYKKRNKSLKSSSPFMGSKTSNTITEHSRNEEKCPASASSSSMDVHQPLRTCLPDDQKQMVVAQEPDQSAYNGGTIVLAEAHCTNSVDNYKISDTAISDPNDRENHDIVSFNPNLKQLNKIQRSIGSKEDSISQMALKVLYKKRELLSQQLRRIADEIALCDRNIETILKGGEDDLDVKIDSLMEGCNEFCLRSVAAENTTHLRSHDQDLPPSTKRKRFSDAQLCVIDACQELDGVCKENSWILPTYNLSLEEDGFRANVKLKGLDFECSYNGTVCATPQEARNSAASNMLSKLRSMAMQV